MSAGGFFNVSLRSRLNTRSTSRPMRAASALGLFFRRRSGIDNLFDRLCGELLGAQLAAGIADSPRWRFDREAHLYQSADSFRAGGIVVLLRSPSINFRDDRFSKANAEARASLDVQIERHKTIEGDCEKVLHAAQDAETEALDILVWTVPMTIAGILALLELWPELQRSRVMDVDQTDAIIISLIDALDDIHPNARLANVGMV
jgi:hypothetical protein